MLSFDKDSTESLSVYEHDNGLIRSVKIDDLAAATDVLPEFPNDSAVEIRPQEVEVVIDVQDIDDTNAEVISQQSFPILVSNLNFDFKIRISFFRLFVKFCQRIPLVLSSPPAA